MIEKLLKVATIYNPYKTKHSCIDRDAIRNNATICIGANETMSSELDIRQSANGADVSTSSTVVDRLLTEIAKRDDIDPAVMNPPLASVIDPDALTKLLSGKPASRDEQIEIRFTYRDHEILVKQNGELTID